MDTEQAERAECDCVPELTPGKDNIQLFVEGDALYDAMLALIGAARRSVGMESYIYADDEIGRKFAKALVERARSGVEVRLHIDAVGSLFRMSTGLVEYLRDNGVCVRWFHRWDWRRPLQYNRRNHRKLLTVDGRQAFVGGYNIHRENSRSVIGERRWRDTHVRLGGALANQAESLFDDFWHRRYRLRNPEPTVHSILLPNYSRTCRRRLRCLFADMFSRAHRSIFLSTPYFVPDRHTQQALLSAARRQVDVRVLVPRKGDVRLVRWASHAAYGGLLSSGVRIYEYLPRVLHAKTAVVDGNYGTIGTANLDYRSFFVNHELNLFTRDRHVCECLQEQFFEDLREAEEIRAEGWRRRAWPGQLPEMIGWAARRWL